MSVLERVEKSRIFYSMSKTWEVFAQSSEPAAHVKNARQTKNTKQKKKSKVKGVKKGRDQL